MTQRYGLLAMSLLTVSAVVVAAISIDPKGFLLKDWQPLIAALVALGGAGIVYSGATLNYKAAMEKVALDERVHRRTLQRADLIVCVRLEHCLSVLEWQAKTILSQIPGKYLYAAGAFDAVTAALEEPVELAEAWKSASAFPNEVILKLSAIKVSIFNLSRWEKAHFGKTWTFHAHLPPPSELDEVRDNAQHLLSTCRELHDPLLALRLALLS